MAERIKTNYQRLFELHIIHHYWLDDGVVVFDSLPETKKNNRLLTYDVRSFLTISPTAVTQKALQQLGGIYKQTTLGCMVAVPEGAVVSATSQFDFVVTIQDPAFFQYTALTLPKQSIHEFYNQAENTVYRCKEAVPVLSNLTGATRTTNSSKSLFLSKEIPMLLASAAASVESLVVSGTALLQLTSDQPNATTQSIDTQRKNQPVFIHQDDIPAIAPPAGLSGFPPNGLRGVQLTPQIPDNVYALVQLDAVRPDDPDFSCVAANAAKPVPPVFQIHLKNRSTVWTYVNQRTGETLSTEPNPLPLTFFSPNTNTKLRPSLDALRVSFDPDTPRRITRLSSVILK